MSCTSLVSSKSLVLLLISASLLGVTAVAINEIGETKVSFVFQPGIVYAALITPPFCQLFPTRWAKWAWVATIGVLVAGLWTQDALGSVPPRVWPVLIVLICYSIVIHRIAAWEADLVRSLALVVRNDLATSDAIERERLRQ